MPVLMNIGNLLYVIVALAGGLLLALGTPNVSLSGMALSIAVVVPFLNMTKQFCGQIGQISMQINAVVMGLAGADRIFALIDEAPEADEGYVTLVTTKYDESGHLVECAERTTDWAWKHPHHDGTVTYTPLAGDVRMEHVDFGYSPDHQVLYDVSVYAKPGQKVAFVGATGAGKTTITNLINRFFMGCYGARAAVAAPPAMILDEATSSIDTRTEAIVQRGMDALMTGRTTFVIALRLSPVRNSDVIICLDHGHVIERGNHDELIAKKGYYYQLYTGAFELE